MGPKRPIYGLVVNLGGKSFQVDDTGSVEPTFLARFNGNIFVRIQTHLSVQFGSFWVQKGQFMVHLPQELENLHEKFSQVDDTIGLLNPLLKPVTMEVFLERSGPNLAHFGSKITKLLSICQKN